MLYGNIFDIKKFAIYDGPGIRTTIFFNGCSLNCKWCQNPEGHSAKIELYYDKNKCINCNSCLTTCPVEKINKSISSRFSNEIKCLNDCTKCYDVCPSGAIYEVGKYYEIDELARIALEDLEFYKASGGGVTLSGGEPLLQIDFIEKFLKKLKKYKVNTIIETAGFVEWDNFCRIINYTDIFYFDLKILNKYDHINYTEQSIKLILINLLKLSRENSEVVIRIPLIPKITDTGKNLINIINFIKNNKLEKYDIELLPYNELAKEKYKKVGINCESINKYFDRKMKAQAREILLERKKLFIRNDLEVKVLTIE
jgi:pyruvate formate lyase activating enzyme